MKKKSMRCGGVSSSAEQSQDDRGAAGGGLLGGDVEVLARLGAAQVGHTAHRDEGEIRVTHDGAFYPFSAVDVTGAPYALMAPWLTSFMAPQALKALPSCPL